MDASTVLAAAPYAKKAWKLIPPNLRLPLIAVGVVVWLWKRNGDTADAAAV